MSRKLNQNKILGLFKLANEDSLQSAWRLSHPQRYSGDESGINAWKDDIRTSFGIEGEEDLLNILRGEIDPNLISKVSDWSEIASLIPSGDKLRRKWQKSSNKKSLSSFISWLKGIGHRDAPTILESIVPEKVEPIKLDSEISKPMEKIRSNKIKFELTSDTDFYKQILSGIGAPITDNNMTYLYAWRQSEGGTASFNPFNTTQRAEGADNYNSHGVKNYTSAEQGVAATIKTINNGKYESIVNSLRMDRLPMETAEALVASPWGTSELIKEVISGYEAGYSPKPKPINRANVGIS
jgi:hypothetical protein